MKFYEKQIIYPLIFTLLVSLSLVLYLNFTWSTGISISNIVSITDVISSITSDSCDSDVSQISSSQYMPDDEIGEGEVVFRYRTYKGTTPDWVTKGDTNLDLSSGGDVTEYDRGEFFSELWVTDFSRNYYLGDNKIDVGGALTIQAWFQTSSDDSYQTIFSNTEGGGFSLKINNGKLRGLFRIKSSSSSYESLILYGDTEVNDGEWHHVAYTVKRDPSTNIYKLCLYLDGTNDGCKNFYRSKAEKKSNYRPSVGAEPNESSGKYTFENYFKGQIYAVSVHDYLVHAGSFKGRTVRDGSRYFNMPSYHDYIVGNDSNDLRLKDTLLSSSFEFTKDVAERLSLPFLDDYYVPQGISIEGGEIFVSYYYNARHKDSDCDDDNKNPNNYPSIIVGINRCTGELNRVFALYKDDYDSPNTGHVGGLAVVKYLGNTYAFVPSGDGLYRYDLENSTSKGGGSGISTVTSSAPLPESLMNTKGTIKKILYSKLTSYNSACGTAYVSYDKYRNYLWIGDFDDEKYSFICGYELNTLGKNLKGLKRIKRLPVKKVQGVAPRSDGKLLLSTSYGDNQSKIYLWDLDDDDSDLVLKGPPGFEDLTMSTDGMVFGLSESGGAYYQKRGNNTNCSDSWSGFYPYIFGINVDDLE